jgi:hypothetical protein
MQLIAQAGYTQEEVLTALNAPSPAWLFTGKLLDFDLSDLRWLTKNELFSFHVSFDADSQPHTGNASCVITTDDEIDWPNVYLQFWIGVKMRTPIGSADYDAFALWSQGIFRITAAEIGIDATGKKSFQITGHDLSELLDADQITTPYSANEGDSVTGKIRDVLAMSALAGRVNVESASTSLAKSRTWEAGTSILQIVTDLCSEINYIAFVDSHAVFNVRAERDPANQPKLISYGDDGNGQIITEARLRADYFGLPNHLTLISAPLDDEAQTVWTATAENKNINSPISTTRLKSLSGSPLIRHRVERGIEAASQTILNDKALTRLREISTIPETLETSANFKPYHEPFDVVGVTRGDLDLASAAFEIRKIDIDAKIGGGTQFQMRRNISLS